MNAVSIIDATVEVRANWREPVVTGLSEAQLADFALRRSALTAYLDGAKPLTICEETGLTRSTIIRMAKRAITADSTGHAYGWFACLKHARCKRPARKNVINKAYSLRHRGLACAMQGVVAASPDTADYVESLLESGTWRNRSRRRSIFEKFRKLATKGTDVIAYPFDARDGGWKSLFRFLRAEERRRRLSMDDILPKISVQPHSGDNTGLPSASGGRLAYDEVEFDGWLEPIDMEVLIPTDHGIDRAVKIEGIGLLAIVERKYTPILGYLPLFKTSYDSLDTITCVSRALEKWVPRKLSVPIFDYLPGAGLPSGIHPDANGHLWNIIFCDNASMNVGEIPSNALLNRVLSHMNRGRAGTPTARPIVERLFGYVTSLDLKGLLQKRYSARTNTPDVPFFPNAIPMDWIEDIFDVICANYNVTGKGTFHDRKPMDLLVAELNRAAGWGRSTSSESAPWRRMNFIEVRLPLKKPSGRSPYVNYEHAQYSSSSLRDIKKELVDIKYLNCIVDIRDLRDIEARTDGGVNLGHLHARPPWQGAAPCDLQTRRAVARAMRREGIPLRDINADVQARYLHSELVKGKDSRQSGSRAATAASRGAMSGSAPSEKRAIRTPRSGWIDLDSL
jgi:hypothetical protein